MRAMAPAHMAPGVAGGKERTSSPFSLFSFTNCTLSLYDGYPLGGYITNNEGCGPTSPVGPPLVRRPARLSWAGARRQLRHLSGPTLRNGDSWNEWPSTSGASSLSVRLKSRNSCDERWTFRYASSLST